MGIYVFTSIFVYVVGKTYTVPVALIGENIYLYIINIKQFDSGS